MNRSPPGAGHPESYSTRMRELIAVTLLDGSREAFCVLDRDGRFLYTTERAEQLLQRTHAELQGRRAWDEFPEAVGANLERLHGQALQQGVPVACEAHYPPPDLWFEVRAYPRDDLLVVHFRDITRRKRAYSELRESEERFRRMFERSPFAKFLLDVESLRILEANRSAVARYGYSRDEFLTMSYRELLDPGDLPRLQVVLDQVSHNEIYRGRFRHRTRTDESLDVEVTTQDLPSDGETVRLVTAVDITAQVRAEQRLRASEERFQLVAEATGDVIWDYDFRTDRHWLSRNAERLLGAPYEEPVESLSAWATRVHPEDRARVLAYIREATRARRAVGTAEYRVLRADGSHVFVLDRMRFLYDERGRPRRAVGVLVDMTLQKAAEERQRFLYESGLILTSTLDYRQQLKDLARLCAGRVADFCFVDVIEEDGSVRRIEAAAADPKKQDLARALLRFAPVGSREEDVNRAMATGEPVLVKKVTDSVLQRVADSAEHLEALRALRPKSFLIVPLRARGQTLGALKFVIATRGRRFSPIDVALVGDLARQAALDIANARLHRDVERARHAAEVASEVKGQFLTVMSHELRTPLNAIVLLADLIETEAAGPATLLQKEHVSRIKASAWHLVAMVEEVLAYSRIEGGAEQVHLERVDVVELARGISNLLAPKAESKGVGFRRNFPDGPLEMETDPGKVRQILINLVGNAIKFTDTGQVGIELERIDGWVELRVSDTGPGIPPEDQERIFEPFVQLAEGRVRLHGGAGLGLAISRRFASMLGGQVNVESAIGLGSVFTLRLPRPTP